MFISNQNIETFWPCFELVISTESREANKGNSKNFRFMRDNFYIFTRRKKRFFAGFFITKEMAAASFLVPSLTSLSRPNRIRHSVRVDIRRRERITPPPVLTSKRFSTMMPQVRKTLNFILY